MEKSNFPIEPYGVQYTTTLKLSETTEMKQRANGSAQQKKKIKFIFCKEKFRRYQFVRVLIERDRMRVFVDYIFIAFHFVQD